MKGNQKNRFNGRSSNGARKNQMVLRSTVLDSSGPMGKLKGTAFQLAEKYQTVAKDALAQNDRILSEICLQYADHYLRLQNLAILNEQALRQPPKTLPVLEEKNVSEEVTDEKTEIPKTEMQQLCESNEAPVLLEMGQEKEKKVNSKKQAKKIDKNVKKESPKKKKEKDRKQESLEKVDATEN